MKFNKSQIIGLIAALVIILISIIFFRGDRVFLFLIGIGLVVLILPFFLSLIAENKEEREKNEEFLEFSRNLAESVKTGTPIGKSIINMSTKHFGSLTPHIRKLANQIALGIPIHQALDTFANDVDNQVVRRAITLIQEAESAGGEIDYILDSVAESVSQTEKLKKERKSAISNLVVQGYIIFFIFVGIMLIMQYKILPLTSGIGSVGSIGNLDNLDSLGGTGGAAQATVDPEKLARPFLYLLFVQGIFTGLTIGKLSEGSLRGGMKHSIILSALSYLIWSGAKAFIG